ncbi:phage protein [Streptococcus pyogenes]|nr:phage protein [Streptococcus pyogenes]
MTQLVADISLKVVGTAGLKKKLELIIKKDAVKKIVRDNGTQLQRKMIKKRYLQKAIQQVQPDALSPCRLARVDLVLRLNQELIMLATSKEELAL